MVSEPLLWPFLSSLVFISMTPFSTSLPPSQQPPQPFTDEPPTSSSRRPWVPDLQPLSLRSFTLPRPLPFASPLQILIRLRFWRYIEIVLRRSTYSWKPRRRQRLHAPPRVAQRFYFADPCDFSTTPITSPPPSSESSYSNLCRQKRIGLIRPFTRRHADRSFDED